MNLDSKLKKLKDVLFEMESVVVAYSSGVDSTFLLKVASDVLNGNVLAVTADSPIFPARERNFAIKMAQQLKVKHLIIKTNELDNPNFIKNDTNRCYFCKKELFSKFIDIAKRQNIRYVVDGSNLDDKSDYRPGLKAKEELKIRSPLMEVGFEKNDIRELSKFFGLPTWNKPSFACLVSRIPYGLKITPQLLEKINYAEEILIKEGFRQVRVRYHNNLARIEVDSSQIPRLLEDKLRQRILFEFKKLGFLYITLDLEGYKRGSMNKLLDISESMDKPQENSTNAEGNDP